MSVSYRLLFILFASVFLSSCKEDEEQNHTVQYFLDNEDERAAMLEKCEVIDNAAFDANCMNAMTAMQSIRNGETRRNQQNAVESLYGDGN